MIAIYTVFTIIVESVEKNVEPCTFPNNKSFAACIMLMTLLNKMIRVGNRETSFFICYLIVPELNLGHYQGDSLT